MSGYIDTHEDVQSGSLPHAVPGQVARDIILELEVRLGRCGDAGQALVGELQGPDFECRDLGNYDIFRQFLSQPARDALNYCAGAKRRRITFTMWRWRKKAKPWHKHIHGDGKQ